MSSLDLELDSKMSALEREWRQAYEASIAARSAYQTLSARTTSDVALLDAALERLDRAEALKARVMAKIERLEDQILGHE